MSQETTLPEMITQSAFFRSIAGGDTEMVGHVLDGTVKVALFGSPEEEKLIQEAIEAYKAANPKNAANAAQVARTANQAPVAPTPVAEGTPADNESAEESEEDLDEEDQEDKDEEEVHDLHRYKHHTTLFIAVESGRTEVLKMLLDSDAKIHLNYSHKVIGTPLMEAVRKENSEMVKLLLEAGADATLNAEHAKHVFKESSGNALVDAAALEGMEMYDMMIEHGVDPLTTIAADGKNALMHAVRGSYAANVRRLVKVGFDLDARTIPTEKELEGLAELHKIAGDNTEFVAEEQGTTALGFVDFFGGDEAVDIFRLLVDNGADVNKSNQTSPILFEAMSHDDEDLIEYLLDHGVNPNVTNHDGLTALSKAVVFNSPFVVKKLLKAGANPWIKHPNEKTSFDFLKGRTYDKKEIELLLHNECTVAAPVE